jgi:glycosyltransferase involved in cell wall biosynthesis
LTERSQPDAPPLKVLRVIARLNVGGPARHVVLLDQGLSARAHDTLLVHGSVGPGEASLDHLADERGIRRLKLAQLGPRVRPLDDLRAFWALLQIVFDRAPDVIHTHTAKAGALGRIAALLFNSTRRPARRALVVHTFHGHVFEGYFPPVASWTLRIAERILARATDRVIAISSRQRRDLVDRLSVVDDRQAVTIPLGLDLAPFLRAAPSSARRLPLGIAPHDVVVGYVGRFVPIKNLPSLVEAFAMAHREVPATRLVLAGDGPIRGPLESQVAALGIANAVTLLGWTEELAELYSAIDICVLSSINEGTPVAAIEAMAAGKPVIATEVGGVPDLIEHGRTGWLVPPRDTAALARAITRLARDPAARLAIGQAARDDAIERFSIGRLVDDIDHLYRSGLAEKRGTILSAR